MSTNLVERVTAVTLSLPPNKQQEILDFAEFIAQRAAGSETLQPRKSFIGMFADRGVTITAEEIDESRREMLANFPRDDF